MTIFESSEQGCAESQKAMCNSRFDELYSLVAKVADNQDKQAKVISEMADILKAWNNAKGFVSTMLILVKVSAVIAFIGGVFYAVYMFGRTGHWNPPGSP